MPTLSVRVISLPRSVERRAVISASLAQSRLAWSFFDGLTGDAPVELSYFEPRALKHFGRPLSFNEIGCFKSHYTVMRDFARDASADWLLVLEDDLIIDPSFDFLGTISHLDSVGIDCLRLYCRRWKPARLLGYLAHRQLLRFRTDPYGIQSYLINRRAASAIIANIRDICRPIDDEIGRFWEHGVPIIGLFPFPVLETASESTLQASRANASRRTPIQISHAATRLWVRSRDKAAKMFYNLAQLRRGRLASDYPTA